MGGELAKGFLDRGQHGWLLPNPCRGDLHKMGGGMTGLLFLRRERQASLQYRFEICRIRTSPSLTHKSVI